MMTIVMRDRDVSANGKYFIFNTCSELNSYQLLRRKRDTCSCVHTYITYLVLHMNTTYSLDYTTYIHVHVCNFVAKWKNFPQHKRACQRM